MKRIIRLTESDLARIVKRVVNESVDADDNVSSEQLSFEVKDMVKDRILPIQSISVNERSININLKKSYRFDKSEEIMLRIGNKDLSIPLMIEKAEILNGPEIEVGKPFSGFENIKVTPVFIKMKDVNNIEDFTIVLVGNFVGGDLTINITSKGSTVRESDLARIVKKVISEQKRAPKECDPNTIKEIEYLDFMDYRLMDPSQKIHIIWEEGEYKTKYHCLRKDKPSVHKVVAGDNLTKIAKKYGMTVDQILKSNPQIKDKNMIKVGEIINI